MMAIVRNRECCYWKKPECKWEHCAEITARAFARGKHKERIKQEKLCGNLAHEDFFKLLAERIPSKQMDAAEGLMFFIKEGSNVMNEMARSNRNDKI